MTCQQCGRTPQDDVDALGWAFEAGHDHESRICPACAREHARSIEAQLDQAFWG